jgi:Bacterial regulatory proteins, luxR family
MTGSPRRATLPVMERSARLPSWPGRRPWTGDVLQAAGLAAFGVVSPATVRTHVSRAMTKLHARDRAQLVVFAYQSGLAQTRSRPT